MQMDCYIMVGNGPQLLSKNPHSLGYRRQFSCRKRGPEVVMPASLPQPRMSRQGGHTPDRKATCQQAAI